MAWPPSEDAPEPEFQPDEPGGSSPGSATSDSHELPAFLESLAYPSAVHVVESDPLYRRIFSRTLSAAGYSVRAYARPEEFLAAVGPAEAGCLLFAVDEHARHATRGPAEAGQPDPHDESDSPAWDPSESPRRHISSRELLARLAASRSPLAAVAVTADLPFEPALALLRRGAVDVLEKPVKREQLVAAVREALTVSAARRDRHAATVRLTRLSERQVELLRRLASRWPRWTVALRLGISPRELARRSEEVARTLGVVSPADAVALFLEATADAEAPRAPYRRRRRRRG